MKTARIGIDVRMIRNTGIGTYLRGLLGKMSGLSMPEDWKISIYGEDSKDSQLNEVWKREAFLSKIYTVQEQIEYPFRLRQCDLWHAPHYNIPVLKGKTKLVVTIHDLIHWIFRKDFFSPLQALYAGKMLRASVEKSDHIITVSNKTREDLIRYFDAPPEKISVIYEGVSPEFRHLKDDAAVARVKEKYGISNSYFIYVGMIKPHKNVLWLLRIFRQLREEKKIDSTLVLVGRKDKKYSPEYEELSKLNSGGGIIHIPYAELNDLIALYNGAHALIHPSLYEGFGLTLLEAMSCGTPVIAFRSASIPEVAGEAACLVEPCAPKEMQDAIIRLEKFPAVRGECRRRGYAQVERFKWEDTARKTAEIYERVLSGHR